MRTRRHSIFVLVASFCLPCASGQMLTDPLSAPFNGGFGQVEVGGPFAGVEFHQSRPLPSRISFYSPVANSIDLSTDYWKRGDSRPMAVGIQVDGDSPRWLGRAAWEYVLHPQSVTFFHRDDSLRCSIQYGFGLQEPLFTVRISFVNTGTAEHRLGAYVHLRTVLRSCQTYARYDSATMVYDRQTGAAIAAWNEPQTGNAAVIVQNAGERPDGWAMDASSLAVTDSGTSSWNGGALPTVSTTPRRVPGCCAFTYEKRIAPGDSLAIVLVVASCRGVEARALAQRLPTVWAKDVAAYGRYVDSCALSRELLRTGDPWVDRTAVWAKAILATNAHFLNGQIVPMPCPAEYNFFFTHDVLLTDLAAVFFDPGRVKRDLLYIASLARDNVIPHAYYWRDDGFKTEYCPPDDWNHYWFLLVAGSYLRHTSDTAMIRRVFPLLSTSVSSTLQQRHADNLMYAGAPDWWDIGKNPGPRSYMTILAIRAIREYLFLSASLKEFSPRLVELEHTAATMEESLGKTLWDRGMAYLINVNSGTKDSHYYMGSLLAPVFGVLDTARSAALVATAGRTLLAPGIGIRTAMPADFHTDSMRSWFHFADNEAGNPYLYANGGVWPHNNAWYALALCAVGRRDEAYRFYRSTMTLDGISQSPMGQPAFYEYRYSDATSPEYGKIDKPSFLWGAGFALFTGYRILGIEESPWNISFARSLPASLDSASCMLEFRGAKQVSFVKSASGITADRVSVPSRVVPLDFDAATSLRVGNVPPDRPTLLRIDALLHTIRYDRSRGALTFVVSSFEGHAVVAEVESRTPCQRVLVDGKPVVDVQQSRATSDRWMTTLRWAGTDASQRVVVEF